MGGVQSRVNPSFEGRYLAVRDLNRFATRSIPVDCGPLPCYILRTSRQINFYLRCAKNGSVHEKLVMYCKEKTNGNFRVYKAGTSRHPIGYIKKKHQCYKVYTARNYCAKIRVQHERYEKVTTMVIGGHPGVEFVSRVRYESTSKKFRLDCENPMSLMQSFCFAVLCSVYI